MTQSHNIVFVWYDVHYHLLLLIENHNLKHRGEKNQRQKKRTMWTLTLKRRYSRYLIALNQTVKQKLFLFTNDNQNKNEETAIHSVSGPI